MLDELSRGLLDRLQIVGPVAARKMFGGVGLYLDGVLFALIAGDRLFFKVDDETRGEYESAGSQPFQPFPDKPSMKSYYEVPPRVLSDARMLKAWSAHALVAAKQKKTRPKSGTKLANIGKVSSAWLREAGIRSRADLERIGSVAAFRAVKENGHEPTLNLLYALEGALLDLRCELLPEAVKRSLRQRAGLE